jgi:ribonucleoside-diphosphate reductase alpha chain
MPHDATPEEIEKVYAESWKMGLKALAIYRDGCKRTQPLNTGRSKSDEAHPSETWAPAPAPARVVAKPLRKRLPAERTATTHKFEIGNHEGYLTVGLYENGRPGEVFIRMAKEGSTISGLMDCFATSISIALQYGVPLNVLVKKFIHTRFEPSGFTKNPEIPIAKSIMDYIFRWLASKFLSREEAIGYGVIFREEPSRKATEPPTPPPMPETNPADPALLQRLAKQSADEEKPGNGNRAGKKGNGGGARRETPEHTTSQETADRGVRDSTRAARGLPNEEDDEPLSLRAAHANQVDAPPCPDCGEIMVRNGACYKCLNCGESLGCG